MIDYLSLNLKLRTGVFDIDIFLYFIYLNSSGNNIKADVEYFNFRTILNRHYIKLNALLLANLTHMLSSSTIRSKLLNFL